MAWTELCRARQSLARLVMNRVNPRVGNVERLRDTGRIGGPGASADASEGPRKRVSPAPGRKWNAAKPL